MAQAGHLDWHHPIMPVDRWCSNPDDEEVPLHDAEYVRALTPEAYSACVEAPEVVTLCGSIRFAAEHLAAHARLSLERPRGADARPAGAGLGVAAR
jgi:hypothetical protein